MVRNPMHELLSQPNHDERARQLYVLTLKHHIGRKVRPGNKAIYERRAKPAYMKAHGRPPQDRYEIGEVMWQDPDYLMFSALNRTAQELMWDAVADPIYRQKDRLEQAYDRLHGSPNRKGSLHLDPAFNPPQGIKSVDIHLQPVNYAADYGDADVLAGAFYEGGGNLYSMGGGIGTIESKAEVIQRFLRERFPGFTPTKILDFACSAGSSSTPWALAFPKADVHAIDVGAGMLRYAHARAESLGAAVHFHQMDAGHTTFPDASFDLVVSHNAMHEMPAKTQAAMFKESFRLLKPGGIAVHQDVPLRYAERDAFGQFDASWDLKNNNEPYWEAYGTNDPMKMYLDAGFPTDTIWIGKVEQLDKTVSWFVSCARKP
ncbi:MAG: class I SAM-dependent methyltransferase [Rhodospirillaceae bacterium]|nr:class I SAM-dependent methyltransferase [Rhodospirillaceae bacterium]